MLTKLQKEIHKNTKAKGFYNKEVNISEKLMLIVSELSEACEALRKNKHADIPNFELLQSMNQANHTVKGFDTKSFEHLIKDTFEDELADAVIRILDLAEYLKIDMQKHIDLKMIYNSGREYLHGKKF